MDILKCFTIWCYMILHVHCTANTTKSFDVSDTLVSELLGSKNGTSNKSELTIYSQSMDSPFMKKNSTKGSRRLIIVNPDTSSSLRAGGRGKKRKKKDKGVTSLLYQEMDEKTGDILEEVWMYNLDDVRKFFAAYLEVIICEYSIDECDENEKKVET